MTRSIPLPFGTPVAGVSFRQEIVTSLKDGDALSLVAVRDNEYDPNAIEVRTTRGELCGFIPAALAARLRTGAGAQQWDAQITDVLQGQTWGLRIKVLSESSANELIDETSAELLPTSFDLPETAVAKTGRVLGRITGSGSDYVTVEDDDGQTARYPIAVLSSHGS